jgi:pimeloyl-ACP methyl ester carboxylesterase
MIDTSPRPFAGFSYLAQRGVGKLPIVLLHGIGSNARSFAPLMRALEPRFPVFAWDAPGYGDSDPLNADWPDASDYTVALNRWLSHVELSRCALAGHSLGALIAARFAAASPSRVAALFLISPALGYGAKKGDPLPPAVASRIEQLDKLGPKNFAAARAPKLVADPEAQPHVLHSVERIMASVRRPGYDQAARLLASGRLLDDAAKIRVPTAVVVGAEDRITPPASVRRAFKALPSSSQHNLYREIPGAGHAVCQEQPVEVARIIAEVVKNVATAHA